MQKSRSASFISVMFALLCAVMLLSCSHEAMKAETENVITVSQGTEIDTETGLSSSEINTESHTRAETAGVSENEIISDPDPETEGLEQIQLGLKYGAVVGRVSLDQELFETHMGEIGRDAAENEGTLSEYQQSILDACAFTPAAPAHYCAEWISSVCENAGISGIGGNANDMWAYICSSSDLRELEPAMIIAVEHSRTDQDSDGYIYGHVGLYIGGGYVIASTTVMGEGTKVITSLDDWLDRYDPYDSAKWGYPDR